MRGVGDVASGMWVLQLWPRRIGCPNEETFRAGRHKASAAVPPQPQPITRDGTHMLAAAIATASTSFTLNSVSSYRTATAALAQPPTSNSWATGVTPLSSADGNPDNYRSTWPCNRRCVLPLIAGAFAYILPKAVSADEDTRPSEFGYTDAAGRKSYSQVQRAWEQSADQTQRERLLSLRGAGKPELANGEVESPKKQKRRAMGGCHDEIFREQAGYKLESDCNARVMSGDVQFMINVMDAS